MYVLAGAVGSGSVVGSGAVVGSSVVGSSVVVGVGSTPSNAAIVVREAVSGYVSGSSSSEAYASA